MGVVSFDYLPDSPLSHRWRLATKDMRFEASASKDRDGALMIKAADAIDYDVEKYQKVCNRVQFSAKLSEHTYVYVKIRFLAPDRGNEPDWGWIACDTGAGDHPRRESRNEWVIFRIPEKGGWTRFDLFLPDEVQRTYGQVEVMQFRELLGFRLRGELSITPISLFRDEIEGTVTSESNSTFDIQRNLHGWLPLEHLGAGGQSDVYLVREPFRVAEKKFNLLQIRQALAGDAVDAEAFASAITSFSRADVVAELGALKIFKIPPKSSGLPPPPPLYQPLERLKNEIAALKSELPGLPKLLDSDEDERWIITEYFPERSLKHNLLKYRGDAIAALKAFRSLVQTVVALHAKNYVHRDIKPPNVFVRGNELVLGDFGIVYMPRDNGRVTMPLERVGPRDYMPP